MAKISKRIRREIVIDGVKRWITGATEQEYAENLIKALNVSGVAQFAPQKHSFQTYAQRWFEVFSKPNVSLITAITYERQLKLHIYPAFDGMDVEDIKPTDVQEMFNRMGDVTKETKMKARMVLNMVLEQAVDDGLIQKNPLAARSVRIVGGSSHAIEPYSVAQMRFLVQRPRPHCEAVRQGVSGASRAPSGKTGGSAGAVVARPRFLSADDSH